jgi:hypothetical protein
VKKRWAEVFFLLLPPAVPPSPHPTEISESLIILKIYTAISKQIVNLKEILTFSKFFQSCQRKDSFLFFLYGK